MNLNIARMEELRGQCFIIGAKFISTLTASLCGSIYQPDQKRTEFTNTEERVIELVYDGLSECCRCLDRFDANHTVASGARGKSAICIIC